MNLRTILNEIAIEKYVGLVSVDVLDRYRTQSASDSNYDLEDDIDENGIKEPVRLLYFVHDNKLALVDGHHRLDIAKKLNIKKIPAYIHLTGLDAKEWYKEPPKVPDWKGKDYTSPKEIGLS